jgi:predicted amidohydrolase
MGLNEYSLHLSSCLGIKKGRLLMSSTAPFKLALLQMQIEGGQPQKNVARSKHLIAEAAASGAKVVLLPEAFNLGWTHPSALTLAEPIPNGMTCQVLCAAAVQHDLYICAGLVEADGQKIYNSAVLIDPQGQVTLTYRKLNELEIGHDLYAQGDRLGVVRTPFGTFGVMICSDAFAPAQAISRTLAMMGADVILSPSSWAVPAEHDNHKTPYGSLWLEHYGLVAKDFQIWIAGVSNVGWLEAGPWRGQQCIGCSMVVSPLGKSVLNGSFGVQAEEILYKIIEPLPRPARGTQWASL